MPQPTEILDIECTLLSYSAKMNGVIWDTMVVGSSVASVKRIEVRADGEFVHFQAFLLQGNSIEAARIIADSLIEAQANTLAFEYGRKVGEVIFTSGRLPAKISPNGSLTFAPVTVEDSLFTDTLSLGPVSLGSKSKTLLEVSLRAVNTLEQKTLLRRFREVFASENPVDQFMGLYRILEKIYSENQALIDNAIVFFEPSIAKEEYEYTIKKKNGESKDCLRLETLYLARRNEISHDRKTYKTSITTTETRIKVQKCLPGFIKIVKKAIVAQR